jgi:nitrogen-specific signal transduction histidine kinase
MENTREIFIFFDACGRITGYNGQAARELGYGEELYRLPIYYVFKKVFLYQDRKLELDEKYRNCSAEAIAYRKNQTCFPVELRVTFLNKKRSGIGLCCAVNIADRKASLQEIGDLKNALKSCNQLSGELVANITHELRTPVNGIAGFSDNLLNSELNTEQREAVTIIKRCCYNMNTIINNLLDYASIKGNKLELEAKEFNFHKAIGQIIDMNKARIFEKGLKFLVDISDDIPDIVIGDELRLSQVLNNLFSNSVKFTFAGHIGLEISKTFEDNKSIELFFMLFDTGIGIGPEDKDKLFRSFFQADRSSTRSFGGTGLGLCIARKLVEAMKGSISADSEINKGSVFSFTVRLGLPQAVSREASDTAAAVEGHVDDGEPDTEPQDNAELSDIDYINMKLQEVSADSAKKSYCTERIKETVKEISFLLEKLMICIEMENWETAEDLALRVKKLIPEDYPEVSKSTLCLLLAIRKENREGSLKIIGLLKEGIHKEV